MTLDDLVDRCEGWNRVSAYREPGGGVVLMLHHKTTLDDAVLVHVPSDAQVAGLDSEVGQRTNLGGPWIEES